MFAIMLKRDIMYRVADYMNHQLQIANGERAQYMKADVYL
jgi:hypothetical protein